MAKTLAESVHQTKPFESVEVEAFLTLGWARDRVERAARCPFAGARLTLAQYNVLRILRGSPDGLETQEVGNRLVSKAPNMTRLVDKLEAKGLLRRERSTSDRRVVTLYITEEGLQEVQRIQEPVDRAIRQAMSSLSPGELHDLIRLLTRLGGSLPD